VPGPPQQEQQISFSFGLGQSIRTEHFHAPQALALTEVLRGTERSLDSVFEPTERLQHREIDA
jgi:hypothetical protein